MKTATLDSTLFNKWTTEIGQVRKNLGIQGASVAVVYKGEIVYAQGFGKRNDTDPFTPETLSCIASITKGFTAAAIGELVAKKKAKWDAPVSEYLPEFQLKDPRLTSELTFIDLLAHRTGYPPMDLEWYHRSESRLEMIQLLKHVDPMAPLRSEMIYNNVMIAVAGEAAARISGKSYEELVLETVTRPLKMTATGFSTAEMVKKANHALPYKCKDFDAAQKGQTERMKLDKTYMTDAPAGDLHSNAIELAQWAKALMHFGELDGQQVLDKDSVEQLRTAYSLMTRTPRGPEFSILSYGLCLILEEYKGHHCVRHSGSVPGYRSNLTLFPSDDLAVINLSNSNINELAIALPYYIADDVLGLPKTRDWLFTEAVQETRKMYKLYGTTDPTELEKHFPPQVPNKPSTRDWADFVGEYVHPVAGKLLITLKGTGIDGKKCELAFQFRDFEGVLEHYHFDSFRLRLLDQAFPMSFLVTFVTGADGLVRQCRLLQETGTMELAKIQVEATMQNAVSSKEE
ncbi:hypothetical protein BGZ73_000985 [Actinomortierella ambigua]|nr:hypothetical protein BGZ73_000985 [Actinomortierella ambigua]